ncbi:Clan CA, family C1, cathepsin B-like cysteine peptidase [Tritrichomonas foetus]|uniref:Clan CA, family C1, cathepsin B-like cysteine peptidase n=1 Tax=Tritrichomonas foetus TaxID=1144522 RepID=A0A1J4KPI2_9EUKA|nr:Clan CA, family C1, cathepsin B-like cysteine peptidase [Tritrichomonas foetus]|eukprot:OHT11700.1 Clan CA, family C1, cathepsin B-like cysteine peptidase [Tritrichomonas foetus]
MITYLLFSFGLRKIVPSPDPLTNISDLPFFYNFLESYPECDYSDTMMPCNCSYALSVLKAIGHRFCRQTHRTTILSPQYAMTCDITNDGCNGGCQVSTYNFLETNGVPDIDCHPWNNKFKNSYSFELCSKCYNKSRMTLYKLKKKSTRRLLSAPDMMRAIYERGPITATIVTDDRFRNYHDGGVYISLNHIASEVGDHTIEIVGWGVRQGSPYWIARGSNDDNWGEEGYIKIGMGVNNGNLENSAYEADPYI